MVKVSLKHFANCSKIRAPITFLLNTSIVGGRFENKSTSVTPNASLNCIYMEDFSSIVF